MNEEDLLKRIANNDIEAFEILYRETYQSVFGYIYSIVGNQDDAEDILQDTYLKIRGAAYLYKKQGKPMAWIYTIARNLSYMRIREKNNRKELVLEEIENFSDTAFNDNHDSNYLIDTALRGLNNDEREIIMLHVFSGFKHHEIAKLMNKPLSTILSRYNRGLKKMKKIIERKEYIL